MLFYTYTLLDLLHVHLSRFQTETECFGASLVLVLEHSVFAGILV